MKEHILKRVFAHLSYGNLLVISIEPLCIEHRRSITWLEKWALYGEAEIVFGIPVT